VVLTGLAGVGLLLVRRTPRGWVDYREVADDGRAALPVLLRPERELALLVEQFAREAK
jgi:hypothetical protein